MRTALKNVVVLVYADNNLFTKLVLLGEVKEGIEVNCRDGTWKEEDGTIHQIGEHRNCGISSVRKGVIGVYDRSRLEQLNSILHAANYATRQPSCLLD